MKKIISKFIAEVNAKNQNEPEFMQAVTEVAETVIPYICLLYTSPSPRDRTRSRMPSSA